jgi:serine protease inhibitor
VANQTRRKIQRLLDGDLPPLTRLVITNAIYFKGAWLHPFDKGRTQTAPFHVSAQKTVDVHLMQQDGDFNYFEGEGFKAVELPYQGGDLSMILCLPEAPNDLASLATKLSGEDGFAWVERLAPVEVDVLVPRMRIMSHFSLSGALTVLGMTNAFADTADFSGISRQQDLRLAEVVHQAFIDVSEEGTEAAAATAAIAALKEIAERPRIFRADRPFIFLVRDRASGVMLFLGSVSNPQ